MADPRGADAENSRACSPEGFSIEARRVFNKIISFVGKWKWNCDSIFNVSGFEEVADGVQKTPFLCLQSGESRKLSGALCPRLNEAAAAVSRTAAAAAEKPFAGGRHRAHSAPRRHPLAGWRLGAAPTGEEGAADKAQRGGPAQADHQNGGAQGRHGGGLNAPPPRRPPPFLVVGTRNKTASRRPTQGRPARVACLGLAFGWWSCGSIEGLARGAAAPAADGPVPTQAAPQRCLWSWPRLVPHGQRSSGKGGDQREAA